jgi:uncharacterized phage protein (TIGR02220 family)
VAPSSPPANHFNMDEWRGHLLYYQKNIPRYHTKAGRLSILQHGIYNLLMDACYDREKFPTKQEAIDWTWASSKEELEGVDLVLRKFFNLDPETGEYTQNHIQEVLQEYRGRCETNRINGVQGGRPKGTYKKPPPDLGIQDPLFNGGTPELTDSVNKAPESVKIKTESNPVGSLKNPKELNTNTNTNTNKNNYVEDAAFTAITRLNEMTGFRYSTIAKGNLKYVRARLNEGYTTEDLVTVVEDKVPRWVNDKKMREFCRPATLFSENFEQYLGQAGMTNASKISIDNFVNSGNVISEQ